MEEQIEVFYRNPYGSKKITYINIYFEVIEKYNSIKNYIENNLHDCYVEFKYPKIKILNSNCNKIKVIDVICNEVSLEKNIYTIGDDINDVEMIRLYDGYTLNTANDENKKYSKRFIQ